MAENTKQQDEHLDVMIAILQKWRQTGIPLQGLARIWDTTNPEQMHTWDISCYVSFPVVQHYINYWIHDIQKEFNLSRNKPLQDDIPVVA